jgi:DNA-binding MarR family transcriptional regulator
MNRPTQATSAAQADAIQLKAALGRIYRQLRLTRASGGLTMPESSALALLDRNGAMTAAALAKLEGITPQSIGVTLAALEEQGLVEKHRDPADGRRVILSLTASGRELTERRRSARAEQLARALEAGFTPDERRELLAAIPLLERLAEQIQ